MARITVNLETATPESFRVAKVAGMFDVAVADKSRLEISVSVPTAGDTHFPGWRIGAIVGPSGSGKTVVARQAFGKAFVDARTYRWPRDQAVVDGFPASLSMDQITGTLTAVGFSSPPAWVLPYQVLSNGQQFRCQLARALLSPSGGGSSDLVVFDEFTSVVDRQVGQFASAAVAKAVRKDRFRGCRGFVAVTCHYDVLDWLEPDWVLDMSTRQLARGCLRRPEIRVDLHHVPGGRQRYWPLFARHHYLNADVHRAARCYVGFIGAGVPVAFCATLSNGGHRGRRIVNRLVVLPDYQGMGIGTAVLEAVCDHEIATSGEASGGGGTSGPRENPRRRRLSIRTSHPGIIAALRNRPGWRAISVSRTGAWHGRWSRQRQRPTGSLGRSVVSFERALRELHRSPRQ